MSAKINEQKMIGVRVDDEILDKLDQRIENLRNDMGLKISRHQLILAAVRTVYIAK